MASNIFYKIYIYLLLCYNSFRIWFYYKFRRNRPKIIITKIIADMISISYDNKKYKLGCDANMFGRTYKIIKLFNECIQKGYIGIDGTTFDDNLDEELSTLCMYHIGPKFELVRGIKRKWINHDGKIYIMDTTDIGDSIIVKDGTPPNSWINLK